MTANRATLADPTCNHCHKRMLFWDREGEEWICASCGRRPHGFNKPGWRRADQFEYQYQGATYDRVLRGGSSVKPKPAEPEGYHQKHRGAASVGKGHRNIDVQTWVYLAQWGRPVKPQKCLWGGCSRRKHDNGQCHFQAVEERLRLENRLSGRNLKGQLHAPDCHPKCIGPHQYECQNISPYRIYCQSHRRQFKKAFGVYTPRWSHMTERIYEHSSEITIEWHVQKLRYRNKSFAFISKVIAPENMPRFNYTRSVWGRVIAAFNEHTGGLPCRNLKDAIMDAIRYAWEVEREQEG